MINNFDLKKFLVENKVTTNSRMLTEAAEVPAWLKGKLEDVHVKPGQGSIFAKPVDEILKLAQSLLGETNPKELDRIANSTGTLTMNVPGAGYNLVLPIEQAKKLPGAQESEVEKQEGPNKVKVPAITTSAPLSQFSTNELTVIVRPKKDESGAVIPNEYIVLSVFPGDPDIPRASEWGGKYAVVIPVENKVTLNSRLNEEEDFEDFTTIAPPEWNITFLKKGDIVTRDMCLDNIPVPDDHFPVIIKGFSKQAVLIQTPPTYSPREKQEWVKYDVLNKLLKPEYRVVYKFK